MVLFELATLTIGAGKLSETPARIADYINAPEARGRLLGCFRSEPGPQSRALVLRGFDSESDLAAERRLGDPGDVGAGAGLRTGWLDWRLVKPEGDGFDPGLVGRA